VEGAPFPVMFHYSVVLCTIHAISTLNSFISSPSSFTEDLSENGNISFTLCISDIVYSVIEWGAAYRILLQVTSAEFATSMAFYRNHDTG
jgi:hypothetical protein